MNERLGSNEIKPIDTMNETQIDTILTEEWDKYSDFPNLEDVERKSKKLELAKEILNKLRSISTIKSKEDLLGYGIGLKAIKKIQYGHIPTRVSLEEMGTTEEEFKKLSDLQESFEKVN
jgi:hypothetical protein